MHYFDIRPLMVTASFALAVAWGAVDASAQSDSIVRQRLEQLGVTFTDSNTVQLISTGREKFDLMFADIRKARRRVNLEYFNFRNDSIGKALFTLLGQMVDAGVDVNAMYDSFGNSSNDAPLKNRHLRAIRIMGIDVREFDPIKFPWINHAYHRDHRKIVTIDERVCYAGGMNVADYYIHGRPSYGRWRDMHMRLTGPVVAHYDSIFRRMWNHSFHENLQPLAKSDTLKPDTLKPDTLKPDTLKPDTLNADTATTPTSGGMAAMFDFTKALAPQPIATIGVVDRRPGRDSKLMRQAYVAAIEAAQHHIQIVNPYPTNVRSVRHAIWRALRRGVKVEIMVSSKSDVPITPDVVAREMKMMAKRGAHVYYNNNGFFHSKTMAVDGRFCTIGSTNLDARSFLFDYEVNSFIIDSVTTARLQEIFEDDKADCTVFRASDYRKRFSLGHRITGWLFSIIRGFF